MWTTAAPRRAMLAGLAMIIASPGLAVGIRRTTS
jgi:hypothetical protein